MAHSSLIQRFLSMSEEEKQRYMPKKIFRMTEDLKEDNILIRDVPRTSYTSPDLEYSFIDPKNEKKIATYIKANIGKTVTIHFNDLP